jgi:hypothetical protein
MMLFPGFLLKCSFIASIDVVLLSDYVVGNGLKFSLDNVRSSMIWEGVGRSGVDIFFFFCFYF